MPDIRLRPALPADLEVATGCIAAAYAELQQQIDDLPDVTAGLEDEIKAGRVVVAETAAGISGVVVLDTAGDATMIVNLAVDPAVQGQGVGGLLMAHAEATARAAGHAAMELRTHRLLTGTRAMYGHLGWHETGMSGNSVSMTKFL